ncbi:50S ribosomal protein L7ae [Candidatus Pacearchaeota archaeon CG1_02_32_21]|nr:MAG: 50S ribosomal protein L7ae [Candidatus Pacearchaeota archaeon CG1_02_32_21]
MTDELQERALEAIETAKATGKIKKGTNEVTKALEKGQAKLVAYAKDITPKEIIMHIPLLAEEKGVVCVEVGSKEELGAAAGLDVPTSSVAIVVEGDAKKIIEQLNSELLKK